VAVRVPCALLQRFGPSPWKVKTDKKALGKVMYAVIETGGKQYRVMPGQTIEVDTIAGDVGAAVEFDRVLAISNEANELVLGDTLKSARVRGKIAEHGRGDKIIVFKFKRKKQYKKTIGHRQNYTRVAVEEIVA
jgi:large subunit ribosomal protein L21